MPDGPPHQQAEHHQIDQERADRREIIFAGHVADAEQHGGGEGAADRAEAADRDHDQHVDEISERKRRIEADDVDGERAAEAGKPAAEREGDGERAIDVDAEPARHALVVDRGAHLGAEAGVFERRHQRAVTTSANTIRKMR